MVSGFMIYGQPKSSPSDKSKGIAIPVSTWTVQAMLSGGWVIVSAFVVKDVVELDFSRCCARYWKYLHLMLTSFNIIILISVTAKILYVGIILTQSNKMNDNGQRRKIHSFLKSNQNSSDAEGFEYSVWIAKLLYQVSTLFLNHYTKGNM